MATRDPETWMWERARDLLEQADRLHRHVFQLGPPGGRRATWQPPIDIYETPTEIWILVALPGVEPEGVELSFARDRLYVAGESPTPPGIGRDNVHRLEIPHGRFERTVELPAPCDAIVRQESHHGLFVVGLSKKGAS
jgi:HSP20 family molecular chaperone IbpA